MLLFYNLREPTLPGWLVRYNVGPHLIPPTGSL
jgi:hypothetical protein